MNRTLFSSLVAVVVLGANVASAQSYYPTYSNTPTYQTQTQFQQPSTGACVNLVSDLSYGSSGSQVRLLQTFLVSRNYPGGGSWMITGNFRLATQVAVRNFQTEQGLAATGFVDAATRAAITRVSCGGSAYNYNNYGTASFAQGYSGTQYSNYNTVPFAQNYGNYSGTQYNNYNQNPYTYSAFPNYNYNATPYTYPTLQNFNNTNCYNVYPYTCNNQYNNNQYNYGFGVSLNSLSPVSGEPGTSLTIYGTNLDFFNNTVYFGSQPIANVPSQNGSSLVVTVPGGVAPGGVGVYVTNTHGTSNTLTFNVIASYSACNYPYSYGSYNPYNTTYCPPNVNTPNVSYLTPTSGSVGSTVTIYGSGFSPTGNTVRFGGGVVTGISSFDGRTLSFVVPSQLSGSSQFVGIGTYNVSVSNFAGSTSNSVPFSVTSTSGGSSGSVSLSSLTPNAGRVGTQVALQGSGWSALDNTVHFGQGGTLHVPSFNNGTTIYYTIPAYVSPCDLTTSGNFCAQSIQQIVPGPVQLYVTNTAGTSQTLQFQVQ